jgi:HSP20 family protein
MTHLHVHQHGNVATPDTFDGPRLPYLPWVPDHSRSRFPPKAKTIAGLSPVFEIKEDRNGFVFQVDLPGIMARDLEIILTMNRLTIGGKREAAIADPTDTFYARECSYGVFSRTFTLPAGKNDDTPIAAHLDDGVLTLTLPKRLDQPTRRIEVTSHEHPHR